MKTKFDRDVNGLFIELLAESDMERQMLEEFTTQRRKNKKKRYMVNFVERDGRWGLKLEKLATMNVERFKDLFANQVAVMKGNTQIFIAYGGRVGNRVFVTYFSQNTYVFEFMNGQLEQANLLVFKYLIDFFPLFLNRIDLKRRNWQGINVIGWTGFEPKLMVRVLGKFRTEEEFDALNIPKGLEGIVPIGSGAD